MLPNLLFFVNQSSRTYMSSYTVCMLYQCRVVIVWIGDKSSSIVDLHMADVYSGKSVVIVSIKTLNKR